MAKFKDKDGTEYDEDNPRTSPAGYKEVSKANGYSFGGGGDAMQFPQWVERDLRKIYGVDWDKQTPEEKYEAKRKFYSRIGSASSDTTVPSGGGGGSAPRHTTR